MKKYYPLLASLFLSGSCFGGAQQWNIILSTSGAIGPTNYTIPAGKVYILEAVTHVTGSAPSDTQVSLTRKLNNLGTAISPSVTIKDTFKSGTIVALPDKIRLQEGSRLNVPVNATYNYVVYYGLLLDEADVYAANLPVDLNNTRVDANKLMTDAAVKSPRPHKLTVQTSPDMTGFAEDGSTEVTATATTGTSVVSVDKGSTGKKFVRVSAKTRPSK